jgi:hypothetical protein
VLAIAAILSLACARSGDSPSSNADTSREICSIHPSIRCVAAWIPPLPAVQQAADGTDQHANGP